ncbi:TPA: bacteriocin immunity protein [Streptococcus suis]|nr:bacteriocin immunity protein [Streptococcus suis]HEM5117485.1 bacteriocin immunity protein [Streptococcus suis]
MKKANKEEFYSHLSALYQLSPEVISPVLREKLVEFAQKLDHSDNLYMLASQLSVYVNRELLEQAGKAPKELLDLASYIQELQVSHSRYMARLDNL